MVAPIVETTLFLGCTYAVNVKTPLTREKFKGVSWLRPASIRGPNDFQSFALPTELQSLTRFSSRLIENPLSRVADLAILTGLEPATSAVTGRRANQLRYRTLKMLLLHRNGDPNGIRTRATAVKGQRPRPLNDGAYKVDTS